MELSYIRELYSYNQWADKQTLGAASRLSEEMLKRNLGNSFSSVHDTLAHIFGAEWIWLERWNGRAAKALPGGNDFAGLDELKLKWAELHRDQNQFLANLAPERLDQPLSYINTKGVPFTYPLWQMMVHVVNHSSYHRGQITTMLRQMKAAPVVTDFLDYYDEK